MIELKTFEVMQYYSYMNGATIEDIISRVENLTQYKTYCIIDHDKDEDENGRLKEKHFHLVVTLSNKMTSTTISKTIGVEENFIQRIKTTTRKAQEYLIHLNDKDKYQYSPTEVKANFDYIGLIEKTKKQFKLEDLLKDIASGKIKRYNLNNYVDVITYTTYKKRIENAFEYRKINMKESRSMNCIYIFGESGVGKTTYAKDIAKLYDYKAYVSSGGKNPLDDYQDEECIILDDTRGSKWVLEDLLKVTDNNTNSRVGARFYNKDISECKLLIITSIYDINAFYDNIIKENEDKQKLQLLRRFPTMVHITKEKIITYVLDKKTEKNKELYRYVSYGDMNNYIYATYKREEDIKNFANDLISKTKAFAKNISENTPTSVVEVANDDDLPF